jgi:hypothetical protein
MFNWLRQKVGMGVALAGMLGMIPAGGVGLVIMILGICIMGRGDH